LNSRPPIGIFTFIVNGANEIYVTNDKTGEYPHEKYPITIRGKVHQTANLRFSMTSTGWDGLTYAWDGNTLVNVGNDEQFKSRAVYLSRDPVQAGSSSAKIKLYDTVKAAVNEFYAAHNEEIDAEMVARGKERHTAKIEKLQSKIADLTAEIDKVKSELAALQA
jgi:hypothetical protein